MVMHGLILYKHLMTIGPYVSEYLKLFRLPLAFDLTVLIEPESRLLNKERNEC